MIILRQRLYAAADDNPKYRRKRHRAAKKAWEEKEGNKIVVENGGFFEGLIDADAKARDAIQKEKNGAETIRGRDHSWFKGKNWKGDVNPETIEVGKDELARKKFRNKIDRGRKLYNEDIFLKDYRGTGALGNKYLKKYRKSDPELYEKELKERQEEIKEALSRQERNRLSYTKDRLRPDGDYAQDLKHKYRTKKLTPRAEEIRKYKSIGQRIKEDLGLGMSKKARKRIAAKNEAEDAIIKHRLEKDAIKDGIAIDQSLGSFLKPAQREGYKLKDGRKFGVITADRGDSLAHELGHEHFLRKDAKGIGKLAHKLDIGSDKHPYLTFASGATSGIAAGINKAHKETKGEKESTLNKLSPALTSLAVSSPMLVAEAAASKHGMKLIKNAGATRRYQKAARRNLIKAWGTYATVPAIASGMGYATKKIAYDIESDRLRTKKEKRR